MPGPYDQPPVPGQPPMPGDEKGGYAKDTPAQRKSKAEAGKQLPVKEAREAKKDPAKMAEVWENEVPHPGPQAGPAVPG
jgi:hypothetical protein